jgi:hypothetical protein
LVASTCTLRANKNISEIENGYSTFFLVEIYTLCEGLKFSLVQMGRREEIAYYYYWVKCIFNTCALSQNQIITSVFKNIINCTCDYQINSLDTYVRIPLVLLTECHVTFTFGMIPAISRSHVVWYLSFWKPHQIK